MTSVAHKPKSAAAPDPAPVIRLVCETEGLGPAIDELVERAFGPGRYAKTAERLREGNHVLTPYSFCALAGEDLAGAVRLWPIRIGGMAALFLGPIAVDPRFRSHGLGAALVKRACEAAEASEFGAILLVGEPPFFQPLGFSIVPDGKVQLPGPVNMRRVMWRALKDGALDALAGAVTLP